MTNLFTAKQIRNFNKKIKIDSNGCWLWTAAKNKEGYGIFRLNNKIYRANRIAYQMWVGELDENLMVLHSCNTPACINPKHINRQGTALDNSNDKVEAGRQAKGETHGNSKLKQHEVVLIRLLREISPCRYTYSTLGQMFKVTPRNIGYIVNNQVWNLTA